MLRADHFAFQVSDMDTSIEFYTQKLGLRLKFKQLDAIHHEAFAFLELDGGDLELLQLLDENNQPVALETTESRQPYCPHLAIAVEDMDELVSMLKEKNIPIIKGPLETPGEATWIYVSDPDCNIIEFIQWLTRERTYG